MKILFLFSNSNIGGAERSISRMIFNNKKHNYILGTITGEGPWCNWVRENGYTPKVLGKDNSLFNKYINLIKLIKKENFEIIYVFGLRLSIIVRFLKFFFNFKLVQGVRWNPKDNNYLNNLFKTTEFLFSFLIDGYITNSMIAKKTLTDDCNIDNYKVENIYNGIKLKQNFVNFNSKEKNILILANLTPRKGHLEFLEIIQEVIKKIDNVKFYLLGRDEMDGKVQNTIISKNLSNNVFYLGFKNNVDEWIKNSKFIVLPSLWGEGCPTSILEAFSLGVPAIAYDIDGNHELIIDNFNGYLIKKNNKKNFAKKIVELLSNENQLLFFKSNTIKQLNKKFNLDNCNYKHEVFFNKVKSDQYYTNSKVNILIIINSLDLGGTENHLKYIMEYLDKTKINMSVFVLKSGGILENNFREFDIEIIQSNKNLISSIFKLRKIIKKYNPVVHCFLPKSYIIGGILSIIYGKNKLIMSRRSRNFYQKNRFLASKIERFLHSKISLGLANSKKVYDDLLSEGLNQSKIKLIYNGVSSKDFKPDNQLRIETRSKFNIDSNEVVLLCIANFFRYKGHDDIIEALNLQKSKIKNKFRVIFIGKDYGRLIELQSKIGSYNLEKNFIFLNEKTDVKKIFPACDIGVLASHEEGFSNFVLESMSSGLAMIASKVGGNEEAIKHNYSGLLFSPKNIFELSTNLEKLINNKSLIKYLANNGKINVNESFNVMDSVKNYENLYLNINKLEY